MSWDGFSEFTESTVAFIVVEHFRMEGMEKPYEPARQIRQRHNLCLPKTDQYNCQNTVAKPKTATRRTFVLQLSQSFRYISPRLTGFVRESANLTRKEQLVRGIQDGKSSGRIRFFESNRTRQVENEIVIRANCAANFLPPFSRH